MSSLIPTCIPDACPKTLVELVFNDGPPPIPFCGDITTSSGVTGLNSTDDMNDMVGTATSAGNNNNLLGILLNATTDLPPSGTWSYEWFQFNIPNEFYSQFVSGKTCASVFVVTLCACLSYQLFYKYWMNQSTIFRTQLSNDQQITVLQHTIQAIYLTVFFIPVSYSLLSINFQVPVNEDIIHRHGTIVAIYMIWIINIYLIEIASKFRTMRVLVMIHHLCATCDAILPLYVMSPVNLRCAAVLTYMITWEFGIFYGLIMYRLYPTNQWTPIIIQIGMFLFGISRPIQLIWIILIVVELWEYSVVWHCIVSLFFGIFFSILQLYSLIIHKTLLQKCFKVQQEQQQQQRTPTLPEDEDDDEENKEDELDQNGCCNAKEEEEEEEEEEEDLEKKSVVRVHTTNGEFQEYETQQIYCQ